MFRSLPSPIDHRVAAAIKAGEQSLWDLCADPSVPADDFLKAILVNHCPLATLIESFARLKSSGKKLAPASSPASCWNDFWPQQASSPISTISSVPIATIVHHLIAGGVSLHGCAPAIHTLLLSSDPVRRASGIAVLNQSSDAIYGVVAGLALQSRPVRCAPEVMESLSWSRLITDHTDLKNWTTRLLGLLRTTAPGPSISNMSRVLSSWINQPSFHSLATGLWIDVAECAGSRTQPSIFVVNLIDPTAPSLSERNDYVFSRLARLQHEGLTFGPLMTSALSARSLKAETGALSSDLAPPRRSM